MPIVLCDRWGLAPRDDMTPTDAHPITSQLWVGSAPSSGDYSDRFDAIFFVANEIRARPEAYPRVAVHNIPFDDASEPTSHDLRAAAGASKLVADYLLQGKRVLVTCVMGRNRSAFVAALALVRAFGVSGKEAYRRVRSRRVDRYGIRALESRAFAKALNNLRWPHPSP